MQKILSSSKIKKKFLFKFRTYNDVQASRHSTFVEAKEESLSAWQRLSGCLTLLGRVKRPSC